MSHPSREQHKSSAASERAAATRYRARGMAMTPDRTSFEANATLVAVHRRIAEHRGAIAAFASVDARSSIDAVIELIVNRTPGRPIVVARNVHFSILHAAIAGNAPVVFLPGPKMVAPFEAIMPPSRDQVTQALARHPDAGAVLISSPSNEGLVADTDSIAAVVRKYPETLFVVDQTQGSHFGSSPLLPLSAARGGMNVGPDLVLESECAPGNAPEKLGYILVGYNKGGTLIEDTQRAWATRTGSVPNRNVLARIDSAVTFLGSEQGEALIRDAVDQSAWLRDTLHFDEHLSVLGPIDLEDPAIPIDPLRLTVSVGNRHRSGFGVANSLLKREAIVAERAGLRSLVLLPSAAGPIGTASHLLTALRREMRRPVSKAVVIRHPQLALSRVPTESVVRCDSLAGSAIDLVPLRAAAGRVACDVVGAFPPGIALFVPGFEITTDAIEYVEALLQAGGMVKGLRQGNRVAVLAEVTIGVV